MGTWVDHAFVVKSKERRQSQGKKWRRKEEEGEHCLCYTSGTLSVCHATLSNCHESFRGNKTYTIDRIECDMLHLLYIQQE